MKLGKILKNFKTPPLPINILLEGNYVKIEALNAEKHVDDLYCANSLDKECINWTYLPYGPFLDIKKYFKWLKIQEKSKDPIFYTILRKSDNKSVGIASYLRIKPNYGSIEVGHINYSPLLQCTTEGTEAMYLMMKWVFENGYRRYEWKCNALNLKSRNAAQRLGFSYEGVFIQMMIVNNRNRDTAWFSVIDREWKDLDDCFQQFLSKNNFYKNGKQRISLSSLTRCFLSKKDSLEFT